VRQAASFLVERSAAHGHELVETRSGPQIDELGEHIGEVGLRIDAMQFAGFDEWGDASRWAILQVWIWVIGTLVLPVGVALVHTGRRLGDPIAAVASIVILLDMLLFGWLVLRREAADTSVRRGFAIAAKWSALKDFGGNSLRPSGMRRSTAVCQLSSKWARKSGASRALISMVLNGNRPPSNKKIVNALSLRRAVVFLPYSKKIVPLLGIPASLQMARRLSPSASRSQIDMATWAL
jgi:hypothetical protein